MLSSRHSFSPSTHPTQHTHNNTNMSTGVLEEGHLFELMLGICDAGHSDKTVGLYVGSWNLLMFTHRHHILWGGEESDDVYSNVEGVTGVFSVDCATTMLATCFLPPRMPLEHIESVDVTLSPAALTFYRLVYMLAVPETDRRPSDRTTMVVLESGDDGTIHALVAKLNRIVCSKEPGRWWDEAPAVFVLNGVNDLQDLFDNVKAGTQPRFATVSIARLPKTPVSMDNQIQSPTPTAAPSTSSVTKTVTGIPLRTYIPPHTRKTQSMDTITSHPHEAAGIPLRAYTPPHIRKTQTATSTSTAVSTSHVPSPPVDQEPGFTLRSGGRLLFHLPCIWRRILRSESNVFIDHDLIHVLSSEEFRVAVLKEFQRLDTVTPTIMQMKDALLRIFSNVRTSLPTRVIDPFWRGPTSWDRVDRREVGVCYHTRKWNVYSYQHMQCSLCLRTHTNTEVPRRCKIH
ncbi:hypothetical protein P153DRAFT_395709 [Dothidotthia symphoricarpi CBS 119687]|uniref:Uncharacterized protein n=1 Tax=Dothidotthia symphoricarpi CBS 119687 TaxID=1392245 RepID=A0A6A6AFE1_9PLEO|nr:uncharacterized protein P153DRAFT_395709 [Dothidotthia symphoricarpi CBS 119687]KAF2130276.1 hypothetical protein P153DRAFT_395709 [Dothidotthia symphoricarpi CBS 119687]